MALHWKNMESTSSNLIDRENQIDKAISYLTKFISYQNSSSYSLEGADLRDKTELAVKTAINNFEHYWESNNLDHVDLNQRTYTSLRKITEKYNKMHDLIEITNN